MVDKIESSGTSVAWKLTHEQEYNQVTTVEEF